MPIEIGVRFLGKIPIGSKVEVPAGAEVELPGDVKVDWAGLAGGIASTMVLDYGVFAYCSSAEEKLVKVIDGTKLEAEKDGRRVSFEKEEINLARVSSPTRFPGFRFHYSYKS